MFDDILGAVDYDLQDLRNKVKLQFETHYKQKTVRVGWFEYRIHREDLLFKRCYQNGGMNVKLFTATYLLPILKEYNKSQIVFTNLEYDSGTFYANIDWK